MIKENHKRKKEQPLFEILSTEHIMDRNKLKPMLRVVLEMDVENTNLAINEKGEKEVYKDIIKELYKKVTKRVKYD